MIYLFLDISIEVFTALESFVRTYDQLFSFRCELNSSFFLMQCCVLYLLTFLVSVLSIKLELLKSPLQAKTQPTPTPTQKPNSTNTTQNLLPVKTISLFATNCELKAKM